MSFKVCLKHRCGAVEEFFSNADSLDEALIDIENQTEEDDNTGFFFEINSEEIEYWKNQTNIGFVTVGGLLLGCEIVNSKCMN